MSTLPLAAEQLPLPQSDTPLTSLPEAAQTVLAALAISSEGLSRKSLLAAVKGCGLQINDKYPDDVRLKALLESLRKMGWLAPMPVNQGRQPQRLQPALRNQVLQLLAQRADLAQWAQALSQTLQYSTDWTVSHRARYEPRAWLALLTGKTDTALEHTISLMGGVTSHHIASAHPVPLLLGDAPGQKLFASWPADTQARLIENWLQLANYFLLDAAATDAAWQIGLALCEAGNKKTASEVYTALGQGLLLQALWRGDFDRLRWLGERMTGLQDLAAFLLALMQGQAAAALAAMERWLQALRKRSGKSNGKKNGKRKVVLHRPLHILHCLALLGSGEAAALAQLNKALSADREHWHGTQLLQIVLLTLQGRSVQATSEQLAMMAKNATPYALNGLLTALAVHWLDPSATNRYSDLRDTCSHWQKQGYLWLAAEFDAILAHCGQGSAVLNNWHAQRELRPLLALYHRREPWQHALAALASLNQATASKSEAATAQAERRLAWLLNLGDDKVGNLDNVRIEPREQRRNARNQWSRGRPVALQRLHQQPDDFDYLLKADHAVITTIRQEYLDYYGNPRLYIPVQAALPHLIGHPHLYLAEAPDVRVDLQAGQASLHLHENGGHIHLRLQPEELATHPDGMIYPETPTLLQFYPRNPDVERITEIIGRGLTMPQAARAQLVEAISAIAPMLPVHSDIPELSGHLPSIEGDSALYAHLLPLSEGLRLQLLVRPQEGGSWFRPGQGAASLLGEENGQPVQIQRNLDQERTRLQDILAHCPALAQGEGDGQEWRFEAAGDALQLLSELHALDASQVTCVWPEGERMRIRAHPGMGSLRLSLKRQGDWFALQGNIELDDGRVVQLKQLLDLMQQSQDGRFVPLGAGDWLALSSDLRRRLTDLTHLADKIDAQGVRLSAFNAPLIEALQEEAAEFTADAAWQEQLERLQSLRRFKPKVPRLLQAELRDYQREGFVWLARLAEWGVGACLADDMGLGKTVQLLALLLHRAKLGPQLVVAPTSVVANWQDEALRFAPSLRLVDYRQTRSLENLNVGDLLLVSYGLLQNDQETFAAQHWASVVLDEAQAVKNAQTKRSQAVMALQADFRVIASGTPLENHLGELWNLMRFINPGLLGSQQRFAERFALPIENAEGATQAHARRALKQLIQPFLLRRLKSEVLDELPPRTDITHKIPLSDTERHQYEALRQQAVEALTSTDLDSGDARFKALAQITRLRRFCCHPSLVLPGSPMQSSKLQALQHIVDELRDNGHRALVFSQFVDHLAIVRRWLDEATISYQYLDGSTPPKARTEAVAAFQTGEGDIFLISLKAGGSGLNLTGADYVIHLDPWWNPAVEDQASDRAHRIGQQRPVTVYRLVAEHTIEEQIVALHAQKRDLADTLLEGGQASARLDAEALLALIRQG